MQMPVIIPALEKRGVLHIAKMVNLFAKMAPLALARKFAGNFLIVMRSFFLIFFLALFFSPAQAEQMTCLVVGVTDGDTITAFRAVAELHVEDAAFAD